MSPGASILVTGGTGQVGGAILQAFGGQAVLTPTRAELDLGDPASIRSYLDQHRPRVILNPAAYTAVDKAESEPAQAYTINAEAPRALAEYARGSGATLVHFSTDYVFDGTSPRPYVESDPTHPLGVYGASKLAGEQAILSMIACGARAFIFRTSWVFAATGRNFLLTVLRLACERAASGAPLKIVADQHGAPTSATSLAALAQYVLANDAALTPGLYHATSSGDTTWHGFATEIVFQAQQRNPSVSLAAPLPISTADFPTPARRPANSRLDCTRLSTSLGFTMPPWQQALEGVLGQLRSR